MVDSAQTTAAPSTTPAAHSPAFGEPDVGTHKRRDNRFLLIPDGLMRLRGVPWAVKAVAARLRYRQQSNEAVKIGLRQLAVDLGMTRNSAERAIHQAIRIGLVLAVPVIRGQRGVYDARPVGKLESVLIVTTPRRGTSGTKTRPLADPESVPKVGKPSVPKAGTPCPHSRDTCAPGMGTHNIKECAKDKGRKDTPSPLTRAPANNGDGNGGLQEQQDPDAALVAISEIVRGRPLTVALRASFVQSVAEARAKGATDEGIAGGIKEAGPKAAPWDGPNLARAAAGALAEILSSYQRAARLPKPRATLAEIVADVRYARKCMSRTPQPAAGDDAAALWRSQIAWADAHPEVLPVKLRRPVLAVV